MLGKQTKQKSKRNKKRNFEGKGLTKLREIVKKWEINEV